jgi:hypothetical protein
MSVTEWCQLMFKKVNVCAGEVLFAGYLTDKFEITICDQSLHVDIVVTKNQTPSKRHD